ncbi:RnfH family protein [Noviherbaspirillum saxi]|uniref:UPF0125 protein D3871_18545 n=1 Tax=Noviherbaspirillum saxi TaxID=2320863 RepID=A0A3A3FJF1_9BURK|nr:RnfH family protein [Noviherbaspirillum saxi]RJF95417.1 RnfH family protein [Noviherbaspirillum saxi]
MAEIQVQVCYARPDLQFLKEICIAQGATIRNAIEASGLLRELPDVDLTTLRTGIYGKLKELDTVLRDHDRVEIYRPLIADPKDARRRRVVKKDQQKGR